MLECVCVWNYGVDCVSLSCRLIDMSGFVRIWELGFEISIWGFLEFGDLNVFMVRIKYVLATWRFRICIFGENWVQFDWVMMILELGFEI